jgi:hypothetical protein
MNSTIALGLLILIVVVIGALATYGVHRARADSTAHAAELTRQGQGDRLAHPKSIKDHFLRPMSFWDVALAIAGAVVLTRVIGALLG